MSINSRIKKIRKDFFNDSNIEFAKALNKSKQYASNLTSEGKSVGKNVIENLTSIIPDLNVSWLLTGEGEMLKGNKSDMMNTDNNIDEDYQPILDIRVCAGQGIGLYEDENKILSWVKIPEFKGCKGIMVFGESMYDKYAPGDVVFVREQNADYIENGQAYIVITKEDRLLKLVYYEWKSDHITLVSYNASLNPDGRRTYPDMNVFVNDILFVYKVVGRISRNQL